MKSDVLVRLKDEADRKRSDRPAPSNPLSETLDVQWGPEGNQTGFRYAALLWVRMYSPGRIQIQFSTHVVTVDGERLVPIYGLLLAQKLRTLRATGVHEQVSDPTGPRIKAIMVLQRSGTAPDGNAEDLGSSQSEQPTPAELNNVAVQGAAVEHSAGTADTSSDPVDLKAL